ncbi:MarR family transcriptional regulator [Secundilactobacillus silagei]|uniref:MarR family transcriptional regulator n=1 Tax=Secundilactobacillus silagei TaxID=1293415 RepID=UPI0006D007F9|nr:MarR family transcriptional regulator [Secundilactobacillus silagei]
MTTQQQFYKSLKTLLDKMQLLDQAEMQTKLADFKPAEVHTIQYIGQHIGANVTAIAAGMYVTRGAVSKMTKRLIRRELIEKYQSAENKKRGLFSADGSWSKSLRTA